MTLERWIALALAVLFIAYGYEAFVVMDDLIPPILQRKPVWPSTFPKLISCTGLLLSAMVLLKLGRAKGAADPGDIDYRRWRAYKVVHAVSLLLLMVGYALTLRLLGFIPATFLFLTLSGVLLNERRWLLLLGANSGAAVGIWYLVTEVLGIYLNPLPQLPAFLS